MTRRTVLTALAAVPLVRAQDDVVFRSAVSLVRIDAEVSDPNGEIVTDLKKEDFRVFDQGVGQTVVHFSFEEEPLDVILLFDTGGNMRSKIHELVRAVELGFHELKKGDRACVMAYSAVSVQLLPFTADFGAVNDAILLGLLKQPFGGGSNLVAAADDAAKRFQSEPATQRRRAVLIVSDRTARTSPRQDAATLSDLWRVNAVVSELILDRAAHAVDAVVEKTGGATIASGKDPGAAFQQSLRRLRRRYTLYFAPPAGGAGVERTVRVQLTPDAARRHPGARIFARTGYTAG